VLLVATLAVFLIGLGAVGAMGMKGAEIMGVIWLLGFFVLRNFYFVGFELSAAAATPGKRILGLRVASRDGGRLRPGAIFVRNAMRELEVFLPLSCSLRTWRQRRGRGLDVSAGRGLGLDLRPVPAVQRRPPAGGATWSAAPGWCARPSAA
jgi:uncharacterized RDD family membrane protein YckC